MSKLQSQLLLYCHSQCNHRNIHHAEHSIVTVN